MEFSDVKRLDFLEKWETSSHERTWFSILTQHVNKKDCPTLRSFCDYAIDFEKMIDLNGLDIISWHHLPVTLQETVIHLWEEEKRTLTDDERLTLQKEANSFWEEALASEISEREEE